jgi:TPR repeat protein
MHAFSRAALTLFLLACAISNAFAQSEAKKKPPPQPQHSGQTRTPPPASVDRSPERLVEVGNSVVSLSDDGVPPEVAVSSPTDAIVAKNFDYLSWYSDGFYNEYYRFKAAREGHKGDWAHAAILFEIAARYADKYSQHRLSLLHWHGAGVPKDRVLGYVWADLAAERGYPPLLAVREKMWGALSPQERERVPERGTRFYEKYRDKRALSLFRGVLARQRARDFLLIRSTVRSDLPRYYEDTYLAQEAVSWKKKKEVQIRIGEIERVTSTDPKAPDTKTPEPDAGKSPTEPEQTPSETPKPSPL